MVIALSVFVKFHGHFLVCARSCLCSLSFCPCVHVVTGFLSIYLARGFYCTSQGTLANCMSPSGQYFARKFCDTIPFKRSLYSPPFLALCHCQLVSFVSLSLLKRSLDSPPHSSYTKHAQESWLKCLMLLILSPPSTMEK
jgi:hypothetical protein